MIKKHNSQYTLRGVPPRVDEALRQKAKREGKSLNQVAVEALTSATGIGREPVLYPDLDELVGTWREDEEFEEAIRAQDQVDPALWS